MKNHIVKNLFRLVVLVLFVVMFGVGTGWAELSVSATQATENPAANSRPSEPLDGKTVVKLQDDLKRKSQEGQYDHGNGATAEMAGGDKSAWHEKRGNLDKDEGSTVKGKIILPTYSSEKPRSNATSGSSPKSQPRGMTNNAEDEGNGESTVKGRIRPPTSSSRKAKATSRKIIYTAPPPR